MSLPLRHFFRWTLTRRNVVASSALMVISLVFLIGKPMPALATDRVVQSVLENRYDKVVLQQWELSCAAAALATILRYQFNMPVTERAVALGLINRTEYIQNPNLVRLRQGFSLLDMKRYVTRIGLTGIGLGRLTMDELIARAPVIVPVNLQGFPHFVVFRGATEKEVIVADPAFGNVILSKEKFLDGWITYRDFGKVGFQVQDGDTQQPPGALKASAMDFPLLR